MVKSKKKLISDVKLNKPAQKKKHNPFEVQINKEKFKVLGKKTKFDRGLPGVARAKAFQKRKHTLLQEYKVQDKSNRFIDKRIGERNKAMTSEDKIIARFTAERMKAHKKKAMFNLAEEEVLTHKGLSIAEAERFDDPRSEDEDEPTTLDSKFVEEAHFGGGMLSKSKNNRESVIDQLIADSKKRKMERQQTKEKTLELTEKLDTEWRDLIPLINSAGRSRQEEQVPNKGRGDPYDIALRQLKFEATGKPSDKMKSEEEIAEQEAKRLAELEEERLRRMRGEDTQVTVIKSQHRSADALDDNFQLDDEESFSLMYDKDGNIIAPKETEEGENDDDDDQVHSKQMNVDETDESEEDDEDDESSEGDSDDDDLNYLKTEIQACSEPLDDDSGDENDGNKEGTVDEWKMNADKGKSPQKTKSKNIDNRMDESLGNIVDDESKAECNVGKIDDVCEEVKVKKEKSPRITDSLKKVGDAKDESDDSAKEVKDLDEEKVNEKSTIEMEIEEKGAESLKLSNEDVKSDDNSEGSSSPPGKRKRKVIDEDVRKPFGNSTDGNSKKRKSGVNEKAASENKPVNASDNEHTSENESIDASESEPVGTSESEPIEMSKEKNRSKLSNERKVGFVDQVEEVRFGENAPNIKQKRTVEEIREDLLRRKELMDKARKELPYTYQAPQSYEQLVDFFKDRDLNEITVIVERIIKCNHPKLREENKQKMISLFAFLMQYLNDLDHENCWLTLDRLLPFLYDLLMFSPSSTAECIVEILKEKHTEYDEKKHKYPSCSTMVFLKLIPLLFPASDKRHQVTTPALVFLTEMLQNCKVNNRRSIASGLFAVSLIYEYVRQSNRISPQALNFLSGLLHLSSPPTVTPSVVPPFKEQHRFLYLHQPYSIEISDLKLPASELSSKTSKIDDTFRVKVLHTTLNILNLFLDLYSTHHAASLLFVPIKKYLVSFEIGKYPPSFSKLYDEVNDKMSQIFSKELEKIMLASSKPKALRLYEPTIEPVYETKKRKGVSEEKNERDKLLHKIRREKKGALREIRRDRSFLAKIKFKQMQQSDAERKQKVKQIYGWGAQQQGEINTYNRLKNKKH